MSAATARVLARRAAVLGAALALGLGLVSTTALAQEPVDQADLAVSVSIEDRAYLVGQDVPFTVTITNNGTAAATGVRGSAWSGWPGPYFFVPGHLWGDLVPWGSGATIEPGHSRQVALTGSIQDTGGEATVSVSVSSDADANPSDNQTGFTVSFVPTTVLGDVDGVVFADRNGNGVPDAGEGLAGVAVVLRGFDLTFETSTGADGAFRFDDVPSRTYFAEFSGAPDGWLVPYGQQVAVDGTGPAATLQVRAARPLSETLHAEAEFLAGSYQPGDTARIRLTLSNTGTEPVEGIVAGCDRSGGEIPHVVLGPEWEQFDYLGGGVTVGAGETRHFELTGTVPDRALDYGAVFVACDFGNDENFLPGFPVVEEVARVPGRFGDTDGVLFHDRDGDYTVDDGEAVGHLKVTLVDMFTGEPVAKSRTDENGHVAFPTLPAGWYRLDLGGPWDFQFGRATLFVGTCGNCAGGWAIPVVDR